VDLGLPEAAFDMGFPSRYGDEAPCRIRSHVDISRRIGETHPENSAQNQPMQVAVMDMQGSAELCREEQPLREQAGPIPRARQVRHSRR
jgi:hypothetical protein